MQESFYKRCEERDVAKKDFEDMHNQHHMQYEKKKDRFMKASFLHESQQEDYYKQLVGPDFLREKSMACGKN